MVLSADIWNLGCWVIDMAHYAELDKNNIVLRVIVIDNFDCLSDQVKNNNSAITKDFLYGESGDTISLNGQNIKWEDEEKGKQFLRKLFGNKTIWVKTSYNGNIRKNYAGIGFTYDKNRDAFIPPQPYKSWTLNETTCQWNAPVPCPDDGKMYFWNEDKQVWEVAP